MADSNTATNRGGKPFVKGDPRINRKGRPKSFDALRELASAISHEVAKDKAGETLVYSGHTLTIAELILRKWASSGDFRQQQAFIEIAYGKVPDKVEFDGDSGPLTLRVVYENKRTDNQAPDTAPETS